MAATTRTLEAVVDAWLGLARRAPRREIEAIDFAPEPAGVCCSRCGSSVGPGEASESGCAGCRSERFRFDQIVRLGPYEGRLRDWILAVKYERWSDMGRTLGMMLGERIRTARGGGGGGGGGGRTSIIVPVPMPWQRRLYRGIDHARVIAAGVGVALRADILPVLSKVNGPLQVSRSATDRRSNLRGRIRVRRRIGGWPLEGHEVILVDDIKTTGSTLHLASRLLKESGAARITAAVLAVSDERARRSRSSRDHGQDGAAGQEADSGGPPAAEPQPRRDREHL